VTDSKKNIVQYHNDLNELTFFRFNQVDFDFFMALCAKLKDSGIGKVTISFDEFRTLANYSSKTSMERFITELESMNYKQLLSSGTIRRGSKIKQFVLFTEFEIDQDEKTITTKVNADYKYILNEVTKNFTRFELEEFVRLSSKYSKVLYRLLKRFRMTGIYVVDVEEFRRLMMIPKSYTNMKIGQKILKPSVKMLEPYFKDLTYKVIYEKKPGRPVKGYKFTFTPEILPKKIEQAAEQKKDHNNSFHNFEQRQYDFGKLETMLQGKNRKE